MVVKIKQFSFPKSKRSWAQTHYLIVEQITYIELKRKLPEGLKGLRDSQGIFGLADYCEELTDKFEEQFKDRDWSTSNKDYIESVEMFVENQLQSL